MSDNVMINVARGLEGMAESIARRIPGGIEAWRRGLGEVVKKAIAQNPRIPKQELTAVDLAERIGILSPERKPRTKRRKVR